MKKSVVMVLSILLLLSIVTHIYIRYDKRMPEPEITIIETPTQTEPYIPEWNKVVEIENVFEGENIALNKPIEANGIAAQYVAVNANDGDTNSYWEGAGKNYPNVLTLDLEEIHTIDGIVLKVNPNSIWGARKQTFSIEGSDDSEEFLTLVEEKGYNYDPKTGNYVTIDLDEIETRYIQIVFTGNSGANAGQVAEIEIYE